VTAGVNGHGRPAFRLAALTAWTTAGSGCQEGNYGLLGMLVNTRAADKAFAEGRGPDPALEDNATGGGDHQRQRGRFEQSGPEQADRGVGRTRHCDGHHLLRQAKSERA